MFEKIFKAARQKGQVLVFYALALPTLFMFVGAAADFGWWYLNESRLQNSADAAVLVGAKKVGSKALAEYETATGRSDHTTKIEFVNALPNGYYDNLNIDEPLRTLIPAESDNYKQIKGYATTNFENNLKLAEGETVDTENFFNDHLYGPYNPAKSLRPIYYSVELTGEANHLFKIIEKFVPDSVMNLKAVAIARISFPTKNNTGAGGGGGGGGEDPPADPPEEQPVEPPVDPPEEFEELKAGNVIVGNWEVQNYYAKKIKDPAAYTKKYGRTLFTGKWNHFRDPDKNIHSNDSAGHYKDEDLRIYDGSANTYGTPANGGNKYSSNELESINLDFTQDINYTYTNGEDGYSTYDWDIGWDMPPDVSSISAINGGSKTVRTHSQFYFDKAYTGRKGNKNDILYARIESEPMWSNLGFKNMKQLNTVRQIVLNINDSNMDETKRPLVIFYDGPETNSINPNLTADEKAGFFDGTKRIRQSQPVVMNLNADFRGILYAPNSPVVFNSNGHAFEGLVIAKNFLSLKTDSDFYVEDGKYYASESNRTEYFKITNKTGNSMFIDATGNVQYKAYTGSYKVGTYETFGHTELDETFFMTDTDRDVFHILKNGIDNLITVSEISQQ